MLEVLISGKSSFKIEVPYKLIETGTQKKKPLIIYLHGFNQNIKLFQKLTKPLLKVEAYHLYIQAPYPVQDKTRTKKVEEWGRSWYLYDGEQSQFIKSMELSSEFIQEIIDSLLPNIKVSRICLFGYSMGGYLGGYFALSRWKHINESIVVAARIKTEVFEKELKLAKHINFLAIHGQNDTSVLPGPQKIEIDKLIDLGFDAEFISLNETHRLTAKFFDVTLDWLQRKGYVILS